MRASRSIMNFPASPACQLVPHATMRTCSNSTELLLRDLHVVQKDFAGVLRNAAQQRVAHGARLLENFLLHEVLVAALFRHDRIPRHVLRGPLDGTPFVIHHLDAVAASGPRCRHRRGRKSCACAPAAPEYRSRRNIRRRQARSPTAVQAAPPQSSAARAPTASPANKSRAAASASAAPLLPGRACRPANFSRRGARRSPCRSP